MADRLEIHHINVNNGDATLIILRDNNKIECSILIDGGMNSFYQYISGYLATFAGINHIFDCIILTHFHEDHFNGLADGLKYSGIKIKYLIDPGGYGLGGVTKKPYICGNTLNNIAPSNKNKDYKGKGQNTENYKSALRTAANTYGLKRYKSWDDFENNLGKNDLCLGNVGINPVYLKCIAGGGYTLNKDGNISQPAWKYKYGKNNPNNFTLAFILKCGEFRYFIGGDMGGETKSGYIDQETIASGYLREQLFKDTVISLDESEKEATGHICGLKINHHASSHSSNSTFLKSMTPAVCITSVGNRKEWGLPKPEVIKKIHDDAKPLTSWWDMGKGKFDPPDPRVFARGAYFTNLYNLSQTKQALEEARKLFFLKQKEGINFSYGQNYYEISSYIVVVRKEDSPETESIFHVYDYESALSPQLKFLATYFCHKPKDQNHTK
jgi:hypothetical protein